MRYLLTLLLLLNTLSALDVDTKVDVEVEKDKNSEIHEQSKELKEENRFFGEELFSGNFKENRQFHQNNDYILNVNDKITVKMWGAHNFIDNNLSIDKQGNIFLPEVGVIHLLGLRASELQSQVQKSVKNVFNKDVHVYADIQEYQPVSVYVTGSVNNIGLYEGLSTDSILQFIDKAKGVIRGVGSFRNITLLRDKVAIRNIDLYDFLLTGNVDTFQFRNGDTIMVNAMKNYIETEGEVSRPYNFELLNSGGTVADILPYVLPSIKANSFSITHWNNGEESNQEYPLSTASSVALGSGDKISFFSNYYMNSINISVAGEHKSKHHISAKKGATLYDVLEQLKFTDLSDIGHIKIYKKRVARLQKSLLESKLKELEQSVLTTDSASEEEAKIRESEATRVLQFIEKARKVEPKGQLILERGSDLRQVTLEDGDEIVVPLKSNFVIVEGEVNIPNALMYENGKDTDDYIEFCGGFTDRADKGKVLLVKASGKVLTKNNADYVEAGDSILVLRKVDAKNTIWVKDITQILYQIAVGAAIALQF